MNNAIPCSVSKSRICNYPDNCCMKKLRKVHLVKQEETPAIIREMIDAVKHNPVSGWNVVSWNKSMPEQAICFGYDTETASIRAFNTVTKMTSTLAACLRDKQVVRKSYIWML